MATSSTPLSKTGKYGDLRSRLVFLLLALVVYRIGAHIPVPGIDPGQLKELFKGQQGGILNLFNMFSGGALSRFTVFALGIMPYISASTCTPRRAAPLSDRRNCSRKWSERVSSARSPARASTRIDESATISTSGPQSAIPFGSYLLLKRLAVGGMAELFLAKDTRNDRMVVLKRILQRGDIDRLHMIGSWAGAMGQTQFLPSSFLAYAVDADGDGRRDIWGSMADVTASTANFLARSGWQPDQPWSVEVRLPAGFDPGRADASVQQPASGWAAEGVSAFDGVPLPAMADATILLPAGARGPAFMVGPNFRAILRYNHSTSYALAVSLLAQGLVGGPGVQAPWPRDLQALSRSQLLAMQTALNERGFASGAPDGMMGPATRDALRRFQRSAGLAADGYPTLDLLQRLQAP